MAGKIAFPRTMRNTQPERLSMALDENFRYLERFLNERISVGLTITEAQISDLTHYTSADFDTDFALADLLDLATKEADDLDATSITDGKVLTAASGAATWSDAPTGRSLGVGIMVTGA